MNLKGKSFLTLKDLSEEEISYLLSLASKLKEEKKKGVFNHRLKNKNVALIFEKTSTRTRCATTTAAHDEGANADFLSKNDIQLGDKETVEDTARVLGRFYDGIMFRGFEQGTVETLSEYAGIPVWNGLTDTYHPTQILADFLTIQDHFKKLKDLRFTYVGDGRNNMANSLMIGSAKMGMHFTIVAPRSLWPESDLVEYSNSVSSGKIHLTDDINQGVSGSDIIYTDVWCSMGEEDKSKERIKQLQNYQVDESLMAQAKPEAIFMHCLPAVRGNEVVESVIEGPQSVVFDQAENRLHSIKAIMVATMV